MYCYSVRAICSEAHPLIIELIWEHTSSSGSHSVTIVSYDSITFQSVSWSQIIESMVWGRDDGTLGTNVMDTIFD